MPPVRRPLAGIAALGAAALIAGCGGGSDSSERRRVPPGGRRDLRRRRTRASTRSPSRPPGPRCCRFLQEGLTIQAERAGAHPGARAAGRPPAGLRRGDRPPPAAPGGHPAGGRPHRGGRGPGGGHPGGEPGDRRACATRRGPRRTSWASRSAAPTTTGRATRGDGAPRRPRRRPGRRAAGRRGPRRPATTASYVADVQAAVAALTAFVAGPSGHHAASRTCRRRVPEARGELDELRRGVARARRLHLSTTPPSSGSARGWPRPGRQVERRAAAASSTPPRRATWRRVQALVPERDAGRVTEFQQAATP